MTALSDFLEAAFLNHELRGIDIGVPPANVYIALSTAATTDAGGITEPGGGLGYARVAVAGAAGSWSAPGAGGSVSNVAAIIFAAATGAGWGTITHVAIMDDPDVGEGNMLFHGALGTSKAIGNGDVAKFNAGVLVVSLN